MYEEKFKSLIEEMKKYREDCSNTVIQRWELVSVCNELSLLVAKMRKQGCRYEMTEEELEELQWAYDYLRTREGK